MMTADEMLKELLELEAQHNEESAANGEKTGGSGLHIHRLILYRI
jgi:hypothetical protein